MSDTTTDVPTTDDDEHVDVDLANELDRLIGDRLLTMVYQPITSLLDNSVVGYEALVRTPDDSPLETPADLFKAAAECGLVKELDLHCQTQAVVQARDVLLQSGHALFVNVEPGVVADAAFERDLDAAESFSSLLRNASSACPVVLELSDCHEYSSPTELLGIVMWARAQGFRVALDDVDVSPRSLALLAILEPDVIKLAMSVLTAPRDADLGLLISTIRSQSDRTGAAVVCQGIESDDDRALASSLGATHVQGFAVGLPAELSEAPLRIRSLEPVRASYAEPCATPYELIANSTHVRHCDGGLLRAMTLDIEQQAHHSSDACLLVATSPAGIERRSVRTRYQTLAEQLEFVGVVGTNIGRVAGAQTGIISDDEPLSREHVVVLLTPTVAVALLARVAGHAAASSDEADDRQYAYVMTHDRGLVTRAARLVVNHLDL